MKYDEYEKSFNDLLSNPDTALAGAGDLLETLKTDLTALEELTATVEEQANRIKDLQETNLKLYLSQGGAVDDEEPKEETSGVDAITEFWEELQTKESEV